MRIISSKNSNNDKNVKFLLAAVNGLVSGMQLNFKLYCIAIVLVNSCGIND